MASRSSAALLAAGSLAVALASPATAPAAAPWSVPQDLSAPHLFVDAPHVAFAGRGDPLASWSWQDGTGRSGGDAASRPAGAAAFGPERSAPVGLVGAPVTYATSRVIALTQRSALTANATVHLAAAFGDTGGRFGAPAEIAARTHLRGPQLDADETGNAAVAWFEDRGVANDRVLVSVRRPGGRFGTPVLVATDRVRSVSVAVSPRGDVLVAWDARGVVRTRTRSVADRGFHATQTIASAPTFFASLRTALTARGRAYVAWTAQRLDSGGSAGPFSAEAAVRPAGAGGFRPAQLLERSSQTFQAGVDLAVDGENAVLAWSGRPAAVRRIRVSSTDATARFGAAHDVSAADSDAGDPAVAGRGGRWALVWTQGPGDAGGTVVAAVARTGQPFGPPEEVSPGPEARSPDVAIAPDGVPTVVWSNRPGGSGGPPSTIRTFAQASSRTG